MEGQWHARGRCKKAQRGGSEQSSAEQHAEQHAAHVACGSRGPDLKAPLPKLSPPSQAPALGVSPVCRCGSREGRPHSKAKNPVTYSRAAKPSVPPDYATCRG